MQSGGRWDCFDGGWNRTQVNVVNALLTLTPFQAPLFPPSFSYQKCEIILTLCFSARVNTYIIHYKETMFT